MMQSQTHHQLPGATVILKLEDNGSAGKCRQAIALIARYLLYSVIPSLEISIARITITVSSDLLSLSSLLSQVRFPVKRGPTNSSAIVWGGD